MKAFGLFVLLGLATGAVAEERPFAGGLTETLAADGLTVSGISSGGYFAQQLHLAFADRVDGVGVIAAGPWGCARGNVMIALGACMGGEAPPALEPLQADLAAAVAAGGIAPAAAREGDRAWFFHGTEDGTVSTAVAGAGPTFYAALLGDDAVVTVDDIGATHTFPTLANGSACAVAEAPFVAACDYDAVGAMLGHLLGDLEPRAADHAPTFETLTVPDAASSSLLDTAYVFVPEACRRDGASCRTHVVFHGCAMSSGAVGTGFIEQAGYVEWAAANGLVVLFPQVLASGVNPYGCWDWWGYGGADYQLRTGTQLTAVMALVDSLRD
ncbi:MAG: polyhydroxybutyrate depolymerase [Pseudomonadota bacterium]